MGELDPALWGPPPLVCWNCNKTFVPTATFYASVLANKIPDDQIICDCGPAYMDVMNAYHKFWEEVWS